MLQWVLRRHVAYTIGMKKHTKILFGVLLAGVVIGLTAWYLRGYPISVLQPAGEIGTKERNLIILCVLLAGGIVVPVFGLLFYFAWKYRESNHHAKYEPDQEGHWQIETIWWLIPTALLVVISVITWRSSYALDPFKPLAGGKPLHIQVVAMDWKWLFIYPEQRIASVNEVAIPVGQPVDFEITSDTVMSSFWDPQLGGQMYAMPGMSTQLNLRATKPGDYRGVSANIGGKGFADMKFMIKAMDTSGYSAWLATTKASGKPLDAKVYARLSQPGVMKQPVYYSAVPSDLYDTIVMKYMMPLSGNNLVGARQ